MHQFAIPLIIMSVNVMISMIFRGHWRIMAVLIAMPFQMFYLTIIMICV